MGGAHQFLNMTTSCMASRRHLVGTRQVLSDSCWCLALPAFFAVRSRLLSFGRPARGDCLLLEGERPLCPLWREVERLGALGSREGDVTGTAEPLAVLTPSP